MAKYTEELHDLLKDIEFVNELKRAMSTYPMYVPKHPELYSYIPTREELNKKIIDHYRFYEIGSETPGRFLYNLEMTLNEIMPYYNQMYKSIDIMNNVDDIFGNLDVTESYEEESSGNTESTGESKTDSTVNSKNNTTNEMTTNGRNASSKTPQSQLQAKTLDTITAASEMGWNEDTNNSTSNSNDESTSNSKNESLSNAKSNTTTKHTLSRKGNQGVNTYAHDMLEFRELFLNVEQQIINDPELAKCFMLVW